MNEDVSFYRTQLGHYRLIFPPEERNDSIFRKSLFCSFELVGDGHIPEMRNSYHYWNPSESTNTLTLSLSHTHTHTLTHARTYTHTHTQLHDVPHSEIYSHCGSDQLDFIMTCCTAEKYVMRQLCLLCVATDCLITFSSIFFRN